MPIYKYDSPSSASLKRKAKDNDDGPELENGDRPVPGHQTKKAKPTSGYVPGTGKPYKGTARDDPKRAASGLVGVLGNKSTNALLKSRDRLAKQDTKDLNRNAPKSKALYGVGVQILCHITLANNAYRRVRVDQLRADQPRAPLKWRSQKPWTGPIPTVFSMPRGTHPKWQS